MARETTMRFRQFRMVWTACLSWAAYAAIATSGAGACAASSVGRIVAPFELKDHLGTVRSLNDLHDAKLVVLVVTGVECPLANLYADRLEQLQSKYRDKGVRIAAINANRQDSLAEIAAHVKRHQLSYWYLKDVDQAVAKQLGATRTPEVFVLDAQRTVRYHGRIDDQFTPGGKSRPEPTRHDLEEAIGELLSGKPVSSPTTPAQGCLIGFAKSPDAASQVTFAEQIAPVVQRRCVGCHQPGEIGPMNLADADEAAGWAEMIAEVTRERRMPPWHASPASDALLAESRRLTNDEVELFQQWAAAGAPIGDRRKLPAAPVAQTGRVWQIGQPDVVIAMAKTPFKVPASGEVKYQYFKVDSGFTEDRWVSGIEVVPGNRAVVHHVIVFASPDGRKFDAEREHLAAYVPGLRVAPYPDGFAKRIPAGSQFIFQVHYTPTGTATTDLSEVGLKFAEPDSITHEVRTESVVGRRLNIVPRKSGQKFSSAPTTAPFDLLVLNFSPHMHLRGQSFRYDLTTPDGRTTTLLDVPHYDFNWQTNYRLKEPMRIAKGSTLVGHAQFDNSPENLANPDPNATVKWGDQSWEEMLLGYFDIAIPHGTTQIGGRTMMPELGLVTPENAAKRLLESLDKDGDGTIARAEVKARHIPLFLEIDSNKDDQLTEKELIEGFPALRRTLAPLIESNAAQLLQRLPGARAPQQKRD